MWLISPIGLNEVNKYCWKWLENRKLCEYMDFFWWNRDCFEIWIFQLHNFFSFTLWFLASNYNFFSSPPSSFFQLHTLPQFLSFHFLISQVIFSGVFVVFYLNFCLLLSCFPTHLFLIFLSCFTSIFIFTPSCITTHLFLIFLSCFTSIFVFPPSCFTTHLFWYFCRVL